jgi:hypothetical protein
VRRGCAVAVAALAAVVVSLAAPGSSLAAATFPNAATLALTDTSPGLSAPPTTPEPARLSGKGATRIALADPKVAAWLDRYPPDPATSAEFDRAARTWTVKVWSGAAGQIAQVTVEDLTGQVTEAWTGPQVAWKMARGGEAAFGGKTLDRVAVWLGLCLIFLVGLADLRRPLSLRNLDLLVLLSFSVSLAFFNRGEVFASVPLAYPPLVYLLARSAWAGFRRTGPALSPVWPAWVLAAAAVFLVGFRVGLNHESPHGVIDVGYAGVIGANRIVNGQAPYGHMPVRDDLEKCGPADADGDVADRIQTNGRCETANETGDTYGPVSYLMYVPAYLAFGWSGKWDSLPAGHATSIAFDLLTILGLALVGFRFGGARLASALAFAWAAYPFTAYALNANTNDSIMPAFLVFGFWLVSSPWARGGAVALAGWAKFGALLLAPLWATYPTAKVRELVRYGLAFAVATIAAFLVLLLEPSLWSAIETFWHRTIRSQITRESPFSIWGWGQYHARGIPDLGFLQPVVEALVVVLALAAAVLPRRKGPVELAALTAAVLVAFQIALTHWFYLYLPWVLPFLVLWLLLPREEHEKAGPTGEEPAPG